MNKKFELLPHTADIKIRVWGASMPELFSHALYGMFQSIIPHSPYCSYVQGVVVCAELPVTHTIQVIASDTESLLVDFLSEALYLSDVHNEAYFQADISAMDETSLQATIHGVPVTGFDVVEIKAVTYHDLAIKKIDDVWQVDIVFDI